MKAYIGLGSNQGDSAGQIQAAAQALRQIGSVAHMRLSSLYRTAPWGREDQSDFINAVAEIETSQTPEELLASLHAIEARMGRDRSAGRWGPRNIDLDLLLYENRSLDTKDLILPHPRMHERRFVLEPLLELNSRACIPGIGPAIDCLGLVENQRVEIIE